MLILTLILNPNRRHDGHAHREGEEKSGRGEEHGLVHEIPQAHYGWRGREDAHHKEFNLLVDGWGALPIRGAATRDYDGGTSLDIQSLRSLP